MDICCKLSFLMFCIIADRSFTTAMLRALAAAALSSSLARCPAAVELRELLNMCFAVRLRVLLGRAGDACSLASVTSVSTPSAK